MPQVLADLTPRLQEAAAAVRDDTEALRLSIAARDELVHQAVNEGMHQRAIAAALGFKSIGAITRILAKPDTDDDE